MGKIRYRFSELVDIAQLQALMDRLSTVIGISNSIVDIDGTQLTNSGWEDACTHYHRANRLRAGAARQATPPCSTAAATSSRPTSAWLGGDEFVAVLQDLDDVATCVPMLNRLLEAAAHPVRVGGNLLQVSASLGLTFYPQAEETDAEQDGRLRGHHESLENIRRALIGQEFVLYYQPKINMRTGEIIGIEALIRWQPPERGQLSPGVFLPVIEEHALTVDVGEWVIKSALRQLEAWQAIGLDIPISVNVGARQLQQADFVGRLRTLLTAHPSFRPDQLGQPRNRHCLCPRRFRRRLLVADLPQTPLGRTTQDRSELRARHARRPGRPDHSRRCPRPGLGAAPIGRRHASGRTARRAQRLARTAADHGARTLLKQTLIDDGTWRNATKLSPAAMG